ncbi:MAG: hypothetical protein AAF525_06285 [Pseudomonadota bacterium]
MSRILFRGMLLLTAVGWSLGVQAEDPTEGCSNAIEAFQAEDVDLALEEARWCVEGLEQQKQAQIASHFKDEVMGYTGQQLNENKGMGVMVIERTYQLGDNKIQVTLTQGGGPAAAGLGAVANLGNMFGAGKRSRILGHTVNDMSDGNRTNMMVSPRQGQGFLGFESREVNPEDMKNFIKAFLTGFKGF